MDFLDIILISQAVPAAPTPPATTTANSTRLPTAVTVAVALAVTVLVAAVALVAVIDQSPSHRKQSSLPPRSACAAAAFGVWPGVREGVWAAVLEHGRPGH